MYMCAPPKPSTLIHSHGAVNVASSCMPRSPCSSRKFSSFGNEFMLSASTTTNAVTSTPASTT